MNVKKNLNIKFFFNNENDIAFLQQIFNDSSKYFDINIEQFQNYEENLNKLIDINLHADFCFVYESINYQNLFSWDFYSPVHEKNHRFKLVFFKKKSTKDDYLLFKNGVDDIIYLNNDYKNIEWKILSLLRRRWDDSHNEHILIRNGVIIDLLQRRVFIKNKEINITKKEFELLAILVDNFNTQKNGISKRKIYKIIYQDNKPDSSRIIDQLIFRLKQKIGKDFFLCEKNKIKII